MLARRLLPGFTLLLLIGLVAGFVYLRRVTPQLELGVGYAARVACGCRFIEGRSLDQCRADFEPGMEPIRLRENAAAGIVTAYVPLVARRVVRFDPVLGCQPEPYAGAARTVDYRAGR